MLDEETIAILVRHLRSAEHVTVEKEIGKEPDIDPISGMGILKADPEDWTITIKIKAKK